MARKKPEKESLQTSNEGSSLIPALLTAQEVAALLRCSPDHVYDLLTEGELVELRTGRRRLVVASSVEDYVARMTRRPQAEPEVHEPLAPARPRRRGHVTEFFVPPPPRLPKGCRLSTERR